MANPGPGPAQAQIGTTSGPEFDQDRVAQELLKLRSREGLVYKRVKECEALKAVAQVWKQSQVPAIARLDNATAAMRMVELFLENERPVEHRDSLKIAYGLIVDGLSRDERMRRYLEQPESRKTIRSDRSIERYSREMATQLAATLVSAVSGNPASVGDTDHGGQPPAPALEGRPLQPLRVEHTERLVRFGPGRVIKDTLMTMHMVALEPGEHTRHIRWEYYADRSEGALEIVPEYGCEPAGESAFEDGVTHMRVHIPRRLERGDFHLLSYRILFHTGEPIHPRMLNMISNEDSGSYVLHTQFHRDSTPSALWTYSGMSHYQAQMAEYRKQVRVAHDGSRYIRQRWESLRAGLCYGVTWDWAGDR